MMTVNDYAAKVTEIMDWNDMTPLFLEDHEVEWVVDCFNRGFPPSLCTFGIGDCREAYAAEMRRQKLWQRVDELLARAAA